ncbi:hypothetical protein ACYCVF_07420 [Bradyrhizobium sp. 1.29L]
MNSPYGVIPISGFESLRASWLKISGAGKTLYGLLVYHASDHKFPEYIAAKGLSALHSHVGEHCTLFVIHSPSQEYIAYARMQSNLWAKLFDQAALAPAVADIPHLPDEPLLSIDGERRSARQLLTPSNNDFLLADEIRTILKHFDCQASEHPCLMFFTDLNADKFWFVDLKQWLHWSSESLAIGFRNYFEGEEFSKLVAGR